MFHVKNLTKIYGQTAAVNDVSFSLEKGSCIALLGANGAGKTTTLRMLSGLLTPNDGSITFEGAEPGADIRSQIGYLPQHPVFHAWMTGKEFLVYVGQLADLTKEEARKRADYYLERVGILEAKNQRIGKYSGGMRQRLGIAQAMIHQPKMIMLDEPVSSLDPIGRREVLTLMEELKEDTTILFSTHILSDAEEISDGLLLMHHGEILEQGTLVSLREKYQSTKIDLAFKTFDEEQLATLKTLPGIGEVTANRDGMVCLVNDTEQARQAILAKSVEANWPLTDFSVGKTTLEDMFMEVVNK